MLKPNKCYESLINPFPCSGAWLAREEETREAVGGKASTGEGGEGVPGVH